jgi:hypothetical protein
MTHVANPRTPAEQLYNDGHIITRNPIERCNGALTTITGGVVVDSPEKVCTITVACCVRHNICLQQGEVMAVDPDVQELTAQEDIHHLGGVINNDGPNNLIRTRFTR